MIIIIKLKASSNVVSRQAMFGVFKSSRYPSFLQLICNAIGLLLTDWNQTGQIPEI